jgi:hypothetical protein
MTHLVLRYQTRKPADSLCVELKDARIPELKGLHLDGFRCRRRWVVVGCRCRDICDLEVEWRSRCRANLARLDGEFFDFSKL